MNILIKNGRVMLREEHGWRLDKADLRIRGSRIAQISAALPEEKGETVLDASDMLVMPGLINAHTHAYMSLHRNYADDLAFFDWLDKVQQVEDGMTEADIYWATKLAVIEMLRSGTTCFVDMTLKSGREKTGPLSAAAGAVLETGIRAVISRGLAGTADSDESLMKYGQAVYEMDLFRDESRLQFMHGPHAPYSCMADYLKKLTRSSRDRGIRQTIHLSESRTETENMIRERGVTPIRYVFDQGVFDVPVLAAHCVYATDDDIRILAENRVSVAINPRSNMKLGNGFAPVKKLLEAGVNVCLGTDGAGSNNSLNMFLEMNAAAMVYKGDNREAQCVSASDALRMATVSGAKAIGREGELGILKEGALADMILIRLDEPQFMPASNILSGLVYSSNGSEVDTVIVDGNVLMRNRRLLTVNEEEVYAACEKAAARLGMKKADFISDTLA